MDEPKQELCDKTSGLKNDINEKNQQIDEPLNRLESDAVARSVHGEQESSKGSSMPLPAEAHVARGGFRQRPAKYDPRYKKN